MGAGLGERLGEQVVTSARGWLGTRFHHQGRMKAAPGKVGGVDCLGLLVGVAQEMELVAGGRRGRPLVEFDRKDYGHLPDGAALQEVLDAVLQVVEARHVRAGDVLLMRFDKAPQHLAIVTDYADGGLGMIHALASARRVVEHPLDAEWRGRIVRCYRIAAECFPERLRTAFAG